MIELQASVPGLEGQTNYPEQPEDVMARGVSPIGWCVAVRLLARKRGCSSACKQLLIRGRRPASRLQGARHAAALPALA